jgi:hypothetical protein
MRKNLKAPASSRIIPFLKGEIRRRKSRLCKNLLNTVVTNKTHPGRKGPAILNINTKVAIGKYTNNSGTGIIRLEAGAFKFLRNRLFMTSMQLPRKRDVPSSAISKMSRSLPRRCENNGKVDCVKIYLIQLLRTKRTLEERDLLS